MSEIEAVEAQEAETDPAPSGEIGSEASQPEEVAEPREYLEFDDIATSKYVKMNIDGEETEIPLGEVFQGYNSNTVSTQRFQEASAMSTEASETKQQAEYALRLQQAFEADPGLTVRVLAQQAGVSVEEFVGLSPAQQQQAVEAGEPEYADPLEQSLADVTAKAEALERRIEERDAEQRLQAITSGLKQQLNATDEEVLQVVNTAMTERLGLQHRPMILHAMRNQKTQVAAQAQQEHADTKAAGNAERQAAAAAANAVISTVPGATDVTSERPVDGHMTLRESFEAAWSEG